MDLRKKAVQNKTHSPIRKRQRSVATKRVFEDFYKIEPNNELHNIPTNGQVINFLYGSFTNNSLDNRCYPVAHEIKRVFDQQNIDCGVKIDRIAQKVKDLLKKLKTIKKRLNTQMNAEKKDDEERKFLKLMREIFSVGLIPTGLAARNTHLIGKSNFVFRCNTNFLLVLFSILMYLIAVRSVHSFVIYGSQRSPNRLNFA